MINLERKYLRERRRKKKDGTGRGAVWKRTPLFCVKTGSVGCFLFLFFCFAFNGSTEAESKVHVLEADI